MCSFSLFYLCQIFLGLILLSKVSFHLDLNKKAQIFNVSADFWVPQCVCTLKVTEDSDSAEMLPRDYLNIHTVRLILMLLKYHFHVNVKYRSM